MNYYEPMIDALRNFFDLNSALVFFAYGQVFFVLGLAILLQSRRHSRLELARSLRWLGAFGILHGLHEWGLFFIPIQATYLEDAIPELLLTLQLILLVTSFTCLFQFGAELLKDRWPWLVFIPLAVTILWILLALGAYMTTDVARGIWQQQVSILARYAIAFPAAMLAAFGLRYQADKYIKPLNLTHIYRTFRIAGLALFAYAILAGLIVPFGNFWPASIINDSLSVVWLGVPIPVFRSLAGLVIAIAIIRGLEVFDLEVDRLIEQMEVEQILITERERIGRELHDGIIQQTYAAGLIVESDRYNQCEGSELGTQLGTAMTSLDEAIASLRAYMEGLRENPSEESLEDGLRKQATDPRVSSILDVEINLDFPKRTVLNPIQTSHVLSIANEAISNAARHSQARHVVLAAFTDSNCFVMRVEDDGKGFEEETTGGGYGLRNMHDRARLLGGELRIDSKDGEGTCVSLTVPREAP